MASTLAEKMAELSPQRRARIEAETDRLHGEYLTLKELRKAQSLTQEKIASELGVRQATVSQMEQRTDLMLSTLRGYVEAMGGKLRLVAEFPDRSPVMLTGLHEITEPQGADDEQSSAVKG